MMNRRAFMAGMLGTLLAGAAGSAQAAGCEAGKMFAPDGSFCGFDEGIVQATSKAKPRAIKDTPAVWVRHGAAPQIVAIDAKFRAGSILIDQKTQHLYFIEAAGRAIRYVVGVGKQGSEMDGTPRKIQDKIENPNWDDGKGNVGNAMFDRGPAAPLGARGLHLVTADDGVDEGFMIHGTNRPDLLGQPDGARKISHGCIRMFNGDVMDLYARVRVGTQVQAFPKGLPAQAFVNAASVGSIRP